ncbi:MAG: PASTA domain-containing protein [Ruminococcaceae bacterium]|nr:PASTA domain-containing protein [Oscillospiraceae bacterium]
MASASKKITTSGSSRTIAARGRVALIVILVFMLLLCVRFAYLMLADPADYRTAALDQYTSSVTIPAKRGSILANDGTTELAVSATVYNCFISPADIKSVAEESQNEEDITREELLNNIADGLARILTVEKSEIIEKGNRTASKYQIIKKFLTETEEAAVRAFISENDYETIIHLEETTKRYYRYGSFASHLLGFTGSDNQGLSGLELTYNEYLAGVDGRSIKAADAYGNELDSGVGSSYIPATNGLNVVTTVDWTIQNTVEKYIEQAYIEHMPKGRVECIVMDVTNGELLASAIYPSYDLNNYNTLSPYYQGLYDSYIGTVDERSKERTRLLYEMWNNTIATQTYEPGSTFKIITSAIALEEGKISYENSSFSCVGATIVAGTKIRCHKTSGHGTQTFSEAIVNSCNPAFIQIGGAIGNSIFKKYFDEFGYTQTSGSDIAGEVSSIYYATENTQFETLELAVYSFGQTFKVTPLQHLRAVSTVANGGYLVVPHAVKALVDDNGNVVKTFEYETDRQVISTETCDKIITALTNSTKNAAVSGYNVVSKTGTSEKRDTKPENDYISSCVTFAPAEDPKIAILVLVDDPQGGQHFGSAVAAPIVSNILTEVLPHLGIAPNHSADTETTVSGYVGQSVANAKTLIENAGLKCIVRGEGETVIEQLPAEGTVISTNGVVILYTEGAEISANVKVPDVRNMSPTAAIKAIINSNLNVSVKGIFNGDYTNCKVVSQSVLAGEYVLPGTVIELEFLYDEAIE